MTPDDLQDDPVFEALGELRVHDISRARAHRLRTRCHAALEHQTFPRPPQSTPESGAWSGTVAASVAGVWCVAYLFAILRGAAAIYGF